MTDNPISPPPAAQPRTVRCPACGGPSVYAPENRYRPFCSERCKLHDLGAWASDAYRIPVQETTDGELATIPPEPTSRA